MPNLMWSVSAVPDSSQARQGYENHHPLLPRQTTDCPGAEWSPKKRPSRRPSIISLGACPDAELS